jgi:arylsulfatase A-like enzyme
VLVVALALTGDPRAAPLTVARLGVPLVFRLTGRLPAGEVRPQVVSLVDVGPTLLDLCGVEAPPVPDTDGASFARLLQKQPLAWRGEVFARLGAEDGESEAAVLYTSSWRLALQGDGRLLLSFVRDDPERVADDLELAGGLAARAELAQRLAEWMGR